MRVALVVGHHSTSPGARNESSNLTEWEFNTKLALEVWKKLEDMRVHEEADGGGSDFIPEPVVVFRRTYSTLPKDVNQAMSGHHGFIVELHCNAFKEPEGADWEASGSLVLHYHRSIAGRRIGNLIHQRILAVMKLRDRGVRGITLDERGGHLLRHTRPPAVLLEPFFIDNDSDLRQAMSVDLAGAVVAGILDAAKSLT